MTVVAATTIELFEASGVSVDGNIIRLILRLIELDVSAQQILDFILKVRVKK